MPTLGRKILMNAKFTMVTWGYSPSFDFWKKNRTFFKIFLPQHFFFSCVVILFMLCISYLSSFDEIFFFTAINIYSHHLIFYFLKDNNLSNIIGHVSQRPRVVIHDTLHIWPTWAESQPSGTRSWTSCQSLCSQRHWGPFKSPTLKQRGFFLSFFFFCILIWTLESHNRASPVFYGHYFTTQDIDDFKT